MATPAEPRGEQILYFWLILGGEKTFRKVRAGEIFLSDLRGALNFSDTFRIVFRILFRVFQIVYSIDLKMFRGQFCSALTNLGK